MALRNSLATILLLTHTRAIEFATIIHEENALVKDFQGVFFIRTRSVIICRKRAILSFFAVFCRFALQKKIFDEKSL